MNKEKQAREKLKKRPIIKVRTIEKSNKRIR
jgi:hypothetical protein